MPTWDAIMVLSYQKWMRACGGAKMRQSLFDEAVGGIVAQERSQRLPWVGDVSFEMNTTQTKVVSPLELIAEVTE